MVIMAAGGPDGFVHLMMPLFSAGAVRSNMGSGERAPGLGEPTVPAPTVRGGRDPFTHQEEDCCTGNVCVLLGNIELSNVSITKNRQLTLFRVVIIVYMRNV
jgi:hypothetical protein